MKENEKKAYLETYQKAKKSGVPFFPDTLFKDAVVALIVFLVLLALAYFAGVPLEPRADPADTSYTPRPEWYFLFLFQLLKYFPGQLEVLGVVLLPTLAIVLLFLLPFLDRSSLRHFTSRLAVVGMTALMLAGGIFLTIQSVREAPPPAAAAQGDQVAALYAQNCAACHGSKITVAAGTNLHSIIAQGKHEGMPSWSADLTSDQIDALAGFILSPEGSRLFTANCGSCHQAADLVVGNPLELKKSVEEGKAYPKHASVAVSEWKDTLNAAERTALLNFLVAPDGQRLFATNCASCHGQAVAFSGDEQQLRTIIEKGGMHADMPPWKEKLSATEIDTLTNYVINPASVPEGKDLFQKFCSTCHGQRVPAGTTFDETREKIANGGAHQVMPVWGTVLTPEQINALVAYTLNAAKGTTTDVGRKLFIANCAPCHGEFGEGGQNPTRSNDIIAPISTGEYLKTRDDLTLKAIVSQGQPNFGMSPFASSAGGPLDDTQVDAIVAYIRSWEANPPVELPPDVAPQQISLDSGQIFKDLCSQCHGLQGEGGVGPSLASAEFQAKLTDQAMFDTISQGHPATAMIGWGDILTSTQIQGLVKFIRGLQTSGPGGEATPTGEPPTGGGPPTIPHTLEGREGQCLVCHALGSVKPFPENHAGRTADTCLACHKPGS